MRVACDDRTAWVDSGLRALASHLPFASDGSGNDFWIELSTGRVKFRVLEGFEDVRDLVDVAASFVDLASSLEARRRVAASSK